MTLFIRLDTKENFDNLKEAFQKESVLFLTLHVGYLFSAF